jgi:hypothetical protein
MNVAHLVLNLCALLVGGGHFVVIVFYFAGQISLGEGKYVSNLISTDGFYMNIQTFFVLLQFTCCFGFVRLHSRRPAAGLESLFLAVAWTGWLVLILCYGSDSDTSTLHLLGVGVFFSGIVVYFACLIYELHSINHNVFTSCVLFLLYIASIVLGTLFVVGFFSGWKAAWIFEHCSFMAFSLAHIFLFAVDVCTDTDQRSAHGMFNGVRIEPPASCSSP